MAGKSTSHTDAVLNVLRNTALNAVATPHIALLSALPSADDGTGLAELSGNGYARQAVTFNAPVTDTGSVRKITNNATLTFGPASADWPQAVGFAVYSASSAGTLLYWAALTTPKTVLNGDRAEFASGELAVKED